MYRVRVDIDAAIDRWAADSRVPCVRTSPARRLAGGLDTRIYSFGVDGPWTVDELVLRIYPSADRAAVASDEADLLRSLHATGYPVPFVVDDGRAGGPFELPFLVMERVPGRPVAVAMAARPWGAGSAVRRIGELQARLHAIPTGRTRGDNGCEVDRRLATLAADSAATIAHPALKWLAEHAGVAREEDDAICHYDLHPMNVMLDATGVRELVDARSLVTLAHPHALELDVTELPPEEAARMILEHAARAAG